MKNFKIDFKKLKKYFLLNFHLRWLKWSPSARSCFQEAVLCS